MIRHSLSLVLIALGLLSLVATSAFAAPAASSLQISPQEIDMGATFQGTTIKVQGKAPAGSELLVRFLGDPQELHLREKGKVFGVLWMNVAKVTLDNVPNTCLIDSSAPFASLGKAAEPYRLDALAKSFQVKEEGKGTKMDVPHQLLLLKEKEHLYNETENTITWGETQGDLRPFTATITVPPALKPGQYTVQLVALQDGKVVNQQTTTVAAKLVGFPKWLSALAYKKSLLYGVMATVIAIVSGLAIGLVFQSKGAH